MGVLTSLRLLLGIAGELLVEAARWLLADFRRLLIVGLAIHCLWLHGQAKHNRELAESRRTQAAQWQAKFRAQKAEMQKFVGLVGQATAAARRADRENSARVKREWNNQLHEVNNGYRADLAAARSDLVARLRDVRQGQGAASGSSGGATAAMPGLPVLSSGALRPGAAAIVDEADLDVCTGNTIALEHLRDAWGRAASIDVNGHR